MRIAATTEVGSGGAATLLDVPAFGAGALQTTAGLAQIKFGQWGFQNFNNLTPLQPPSGDSGQSPPSEPLPSDGSAHPPLQGTYLNYKLGLQEAGTLDLNGDLTQNAIQNADVVIPGQNLTNPAVISELTKDGSSMSDWAKMSTDVTLPSGQRVQVHFYENIVTGEVNTAIDFKISDVKGIGDIPLNR